MPAAARRSQLLGVALEQFAAGGYHETSMEQIAEAAGVTKPVLYQHFHSKQELYRELIDTVGHDLLAEANDRAESETDPYRRVLAGFRAYFTFVCERTDAFQLLFGGGARVAEEFGDSVRAVEEQMAAAVGRLVDAAIDDEHRDLIGRSIVGLAEVAGRRWVEVHRTVPGPRSELRSRAHHSLDTAAEAERMSVRLADFVWAGLRGLPSATPRPATTQEGA